MSGTKSSSRFATVKKDGSVRYATRFLALEKGKRNSLSKETNSSKACDCLLKPDGWKGSKLSQKSKLPLRKTNMKCSVKDGKKKTTSANHREKVVIVSKRSSSVSVVKSCNLRKSVSVKKVSYSTSVVLSSDEDTDSEEESEEEEKKECLKKRRTILKHTTSKVKSSVQESKKTGNRSTKKAKAIKLLCDKLSSGKHKALCSARELRPRFPYNMLQEWPTARTHRMASLNALAKVHVLYENEGRTVGENLNDADESSLIDFLNENSEEEDDAEVKKESKPAINANSRRNEKTKNVEEKLKNLKKDKMLLAKSKIPRRGKKRKAPDVEIIDTKICKRMASLNAQAILAASYLQEPKPKRISKKNDKCDSSSDTDENEILYESKCDLKVIKTEKKDEPIEKLKQTKKCDKRRAESIKSLSKDRMNKNINRLTPNKTSRSVTPNQNKRSPESEVNSIGSGKSEATISNRSCTVENSVVASTAATTKVGLTQYTEVTKVQINTHKDNEIKEESKAERKIERILSNEDVAITQMYHYQSKTANESYCVQMQTTYKPGSKALTPPTSRSPSGGMRPYVNEPVLPNAPNYYSCTNRSSMLPSQAYPNVGPGPVPPVGMDHRLPRQYGGSAFTVPHYRQSQQMQFSHNEYGYFQPAGPLIQPPQDQCTIHKPVPYHAQPNRHQTPQRPHQPSSRADGFQTYDSHQSHQNKSVFPSQSSPMQPQQKSVGPPRAENLPQSPTSSPQFSKRQPAEDTRSRSLSSNANTSFNQPPKHVRSPVMPTLYSSQNNFRNYQTQKRVPNTFGNYNQSYERKGHVSKRGVYDLVPSFSESHSGIPGKVTSLGPVHSRSGNSQHSKALQHYSPNSHSGDHFKNINNPVNSKERTWGYKSSHSTSSNCTQSISSDVCNLGPSPIMCNSSTSNMYNPDASSSMCNPGASSNMCNPGASSSMCHPGASSNICHDTSSNFMPYHSSSSKDVHNSNLNEMVSYPMRPPSVIEIEDDNPRDTKTYIQLEVPKNSHREKIVVVDVEDDEIEKKHIRSKNSDMPNPTFDRPLDKTDKKHFRSRNVDLANPNFDRPQDKLEKKHANLKNSDVPNPTFDKSQNRIEKKHVSSVNSDVPNPTFDKSHNKIEKKHVHSRNGDIPKSTSDRPQDKVEKQVISKNSDMPRSIFDTAQDKIVPATKIDHSNIIEKTEPDFDIPQDNMFLKDLIVKTEEIIVENTPAVAEDISPQKDKSDDQDSESPDVMFIEIKKKKESAVVRRARLHGKQRTFRDCYNRPLAQLFKSKKNDDFSNISEQHLTKEFQPLVSLPRLVLPKLEKTPAHGWSWEGTPRDKLVYISNDDPPCIRRCYPSMRHIEGDIICVRDCVFLRSGPRKTDLPFVAKVTALWETPSNGEMIMSLLWYYRPEHTETIKKTHLMEEEVFASKHRDTNSVACIEDKCYVLTYSEYCRYRKKCRLLEDTSPCLVSVVPEGEEYPRKKRLPPRVVSSDLVLFCRKVYDYRQKRLLKNPV